jgi:hypothetical protein
VPADDWNIDAGALQLQDMARPATWTMDRTRPERILGDELKIPNLAISLHEEGNMNTRNEKTRLNL